MNQTTIESSRSTSGVACPRPMPSPTQLKAASIGQVRSAHQPREPLGGGPRGLIVSSVMASMCKAANRKKTLSQ